MKSAGLDLLCLDAVKRTAYHDDGEWMATRALGWGYDGIRVPNRRMYAVYHVG